jgi:hypothetical protein
MLGHMTNWIPVLGAALLMVGCGKVTAAPDAAAPPGGADAALLDGASIDAPAADAPAAACDVAKPFAAATEVPGIHDAAANDVHASLTADELTIYFASDRADPTSPTMHLYSATRASRDAAFGTPAIVGGTFSTEGESNPSISPDGNTLYFDSLRVSEGTVHIFTSTRASAAVVFPTPTIIAGDFLIAPSITADGKVLYVADLTMGRLARLDRVGGGFGPHQTVALQTPMSVSFPVSSDDLTLFMAFGTSSGNEILVTKRASTTSAFPPPAQVAELKTDAVQAEPSWISADGCRLYLRYQADGDKSRIHVAVRPR